MNLWIIGIHQRQFLFVHQDAGGDWSHQVVTPINKVSQYRNVGFFERINGIEITELKFWHATAFFLWHHVDVNVVVLKHLDEIFTYLGAVVIAVAGGVKRYFPRCLTNRLGFYRSRKALYALSQITGMHFWQRRLMMDVQSFLHHLSEARAVVKRVHGDVNQRNGHDAEHGIGAREGFIAEARTLFLKFNGLRT